MALAAISALVATAIHTTRIDLTWQNNAAYTAILVLRNRDGAGWFWRASILGNLEYWSDTECDEDVPYCYYLIALTIPPWEEAPDSNIDCATPPVTLVAPSDVVATPISDIEIEVIFKDNSEDETGHTLEREISTDPGVWRSILVLEPNREFFRDGGLFLTVAGYTDCVPSDIGKQVQDDTVEIGLLVDYDNVRRRWLIDSGDTVANASDMTITGGTGVGVAIRETKGLVQGSSYTYRVSAEGPGGPAGPVESNLATTISEPAAPVLAAILSADIQDKSIRIRWSDVAIETGYRIEQSKTAELPFAADEGDLIAVVGVGVTDFLATGLDVNTAYSFRVRAYNGGGNSAYSGTVAGTTLAAYVRTEFEKWVRNPNIEPVYLTEIYTKMDLTGFTLESGVTWKKTIGASDRGIDILEVFEDGEAYVEKTSIATVEATANTFWFDYDNRILYVHATGDADPAGFLIEGAFWLYFSTHKDIEFSTSIDQLSNCDTLPDGWTGTDLSIDTADKKEGFGSLKDNVAVPVFDAWYQTIYNPTGSQNWSDKKYLLFWLKCDRAHTDFTYAWLRITDTSMNWRRWNLTFSAGEWTAIKLPLSTGDDESGTPPDLASINFVLIYFKAADTTPFYKKIDDVRLAGRLNHYLPLLTKEDIPDITQEIKPYFEGSFGIASGSIAFINGKIMGEYFFDKKYANYTWENSKVVLKAGRDDFVYANFNTILTSLIDQKSCNDSKITFTLRDIRQEMERNLILNTFTVGEFPDIEEDFIGEQIPLCFGTKYRVVPIPINVVRRKYNFHDGRSKSVVAVYKNVLSTPSPLIEDTDYFIDLQRSIITFERDAFILEDEDIIEIAFIGTVNSADEPVANGAEVFKYLMNEHYGLLNSELDLDSIYRTKYEKTDELSIFLYKNTPYREIVRNIEHSTEAFTFQDANGRLGLNPQLTVAESKAKYIRNHQIFDHLQLKTRKSLFWKVKVSYDENPQSQIRAYVSAQDDNIWYRYKNKNILNISSYFSAPSSAQSLATSVLTLLNKETIKNTLPMLLFDVMAGDIIKFSRTRFYDADGTASEISLRIIRISKSPASGQTVITAELV